MEGFRASYDILYCTELDKPVLIEFEFVVSDEIEKVEIEFLQINHSYFYEIRKGIRKLRIPFADEPSKEKMKNIFLVSSC